MLKAEQVPDEVLKQFSTWQFPKCSENLMRRMLVDAINAWPGAFPWTFSGPLDGTGFVLPITPSEEPPASS